jgi:hypothetical protein
MPDVVREHLDGLQIVDRILDLAEKHKVMMIGIEKGHISMALGPIFRKRMHERKQYYPFWEHVPTKDKMTYGRSLQARMQQGKVYFPDTVDYKTVYVPELLAFPAGRNDDVVSAFSIAALMLDALVAPAPPPDLPEQGPGPLTFEKLIEPIQRSRTERHARHVPERLFGKRKKK